MSLRSRLEDSPTLVRIVARALALWLRFCDRTTRWDREGLSDLQAALAQGPVIVVLWHECTAMAPVHWPVRDGPLSSLRATSPIGRVSGALQSAFGLLPVAMAEGASNRSASRQVLRRLAEGVSVGLTADGPRGPARVAKESPLDWARASGRPVFLYAFSVRRGRRLNSWDRMLMPLPFTRGTILFRRWRDDLPRRVSPDSAAELLADLSRSLDAATAEANRRAGRTDDPG